MPEIIVTIGPDGTTQISVQGVLGPGCTDLSAKIEAALGVASDRELQPAYYETAEEASQEVGHGG